MLDPATLAALFRNLAACTEILAVVPRSSAQTMTAPVAIDLGAAQAGLAAGQFRSVQVRCRYDGHEWCAPQLAPPAGVRLVRMRTASPPQLSARKRARPRQPGYETCAAHRIASDSRRHPCPTPLVTRFCRA